MKAVYITEKQLENIKKRKIGEGKEAHVYNAGEGLLFKIYKHAGVVTLNTPVVNGIIDQDGVRIAKKGIHIKPAEVEIMTTRYIDMEGVRLYSAAAIEKASLRQENIKHTSLPLAPLYLDGGNYYRFLGCVLKYFKCYFELHKIWESLPAEYKIKLLEKVRIYVRELCDNYIYHMDLSNKSTGEFAKLLSHSNILVSLTLNPQIIDVDGKSTIYLEKKSPEHESNTYGELSLLFLELLFDLDFDKDNIDFNEIEYIHRLLKAKKMPDELIEPLVDLRADDEILGKVLEYTKKSIWKIKY